MLSTTLCLDGAIYCRQKFNVMHFLNWTAFISKTYVHSYMFIEISNIYTIYTYWHQTGLGEIISGIDISIIRFHIMFMAFRYLFKKLGNYNVTTKGFRVSIEIRSCCFCINPPSLKWPPMVFLSISCLGQYNICFMEYANAVVLPVLQYRNSIPSKISIFRWCRFLFCTIINSRWGI